jgi:hypothetical protein
MQALSGIRLTEEARALLELGGKELMSMPLAYGRPENAEAGRRLRAVQADALFPGAVSPEGAMAGLWIYYSYFDECHNLVQDLNTPEGSYWHAILHRQEPDDWNAAYWFRRVGRHAIHDALVTEAARLADNRPEAAEVARGGWNAEGFIRYCAMARARAGSETERLAREIQMAEWRLLFSWCAHVRG